LAIRNSNAVIERYGAITALWLKWILAVGRDTRAKRSPVATAKPINPTRDSRVTIRFAASPAGLTCPYPMVAKVWTLKKNAPRYAPPTSAPPGPDRAPGPHIRYAAANRAFVAT